MSKREERRCIKRNSNLDCLFARVRRIELALAVLIGAQAPQLIKIFL